MTSSKFAHGARLILAAAFACIGGLAFADETHVNYSLAVGATSAPIPIPIENSPVILTCSQNGNGMFVGVGQATITSSGGLLVSAGYDLAHGLTKGIGTPGHHVIYCDNSTLVDIVVNNATSIVVKNNGTAPMSGVIMFVY